MLYYAKQCNEFAWPITASLRPGNIALFKEMSLRWQTVGNDVFDLTDPRFEPQTSRSRGERVTARSNDWFMGWFIIELLLYVILHLAAKSFVTYDRSSVTYKIK